MFSHLCPAMAWLASKPQESSDVTGVTPSRKMRAIHPVLCTQPESRESLNPCKKITHATDCCCRCRFRLRRTERSRLLEAMNAPDAQAFLTVFNGVHSAVLSYDAMCVGKLAPHAPFFFVLLQPGRQCECDGGVRPVFPRQMKIGTQSHRTAAA